jgi:hypothetical protein
VKEIVISILNNEYKTIVCWGTEKEIAGVLKRWHYPPGEYANLGSDEGRCMSHSDLQPVIILKRQPRTPDSIGTLAHEATHAIEAIFRDIGEKPTGEVFAHSVGAIVRETLQQCSKSTKKPRSRLTKTTRGKK